MIELSSSHMPLVERLRKQSTAIYIAASKECADDISDALRKAAAEIERLQRGIADFIAGNYGPRPKKTETCQHGKYGYEECEACIAEHFVDVLKAET